MNNKQEIIWNIVNSALAGLLVLVGACADGNITVQGITTAIVAGLVVAITKFKEYWTTEEEEYKNKVFTFIG